MTLGTALLALYAIPVLALVVSVPTGELVMQLNDPVVLGAAKTSLFSASVSVVIATVLGLPLAYWLARANSRLKTVVLAVVVFPLVLPPTVSGMMLLTVFGPGSLIGDAAIVGGIPLTRSLLGVIFAQTFVASPFVVVTAKAAFETVDVRLEDASRSLGKSRLVTAQRVTLPIAGPGILAGITLAFARAIGEFGATIMISFYPRTMPVQIWVAFLSQGLENAYPAAILLLLIAAGALMLLHTAATNPWS